MRHSAFGRFVCALLALSLLLVHAPAVAFGAPPDGCSTAGCCGASVADPARGDACCGDSLADCAGDTVAGDTAAGDTVAGDTAAGDTVAGDDAPPAPRDGCAGCHCGCCGRVPLVADPDTTPAADGPANPRTPLDLPGLHLARPLEVFHPPRR